MAPFNPVNLGPAGETALYLVIGFFFGFVLERAGFGDSRKLAAQFYLRDMTVLKVMFTAIVTAMLLLHIGSGLSLVDMGRMYVNPTYLWPGILGGFIFGLGFIIGGYCPGTSLVSASTLKIDGMFFVGGVLAGTLVFAETVAHFEGFFNYSGALGRLTIQDWLGVGTAPVVVGVLIMAVAAFLGVEKLERALSRDPARKPLFSLKSISTRFALVAVAGLALAFSNPPRPSVRLAKMEPQLQKALASRQFHIDPAELLEMLHNQRMKVYPLDLRSEADYNIFHLRDSRRVSKSELNAVLKDIDPAGVVVVMSNGEAAADQAWKYLKAAGLPNVYVLEGGVNHWVEVYGPGPAVWRGSADSDEDAARWEFPRAVGASLDLALPEAEQAPKREFTAKVKVAKPAGPVGGGCG